LLRRAWRARSPLEKMGKFLDLVLSWRIQRGFVVVDREQMELEKELGAR